jgi:S-adenosyl-L-methionine hydrolase (adenosine-forming)
MNPRDTVTVLSDCGSTSETPGVLASILRDLAPHAVLVHLTHDVDPYDVRQGSLALARAIGYVAEGVVVASVDPATDRALIAVEIGQGAGILLGPDNGLLAPAVALAGGAERAVLLSNDELHLASPGGVMAIRDVLLPVAAHLCNGVAFDELGDAVDVEGLLPGVIPIARVEDGVVLAEVLYVDRYGNAQLNVSSEELDALGDVISVGLGDARRTARRAPSVIGLGEADLALVPDPYGLVALALCRRHAALELAIDVGSAVHLRSLSDEPPGGPGQSGHRTSTPVQLRR